jgi:hypothetical protein
MYVHLSAETARRGGRMDGAAETACGRAVSDERKLTSSPRDVTCHYCEAVIRGIRPKQVLEERRKAAEEREKAIADVVKRWRHGEMANLDATSSLVRLGLPLWKAEMTLEKQKERK